jgi:hypothetical protein
METQLRATFSACGLKALTGFTTNLSENRPALRGIEIQVNADGTATAVASNGVRLMVITGKGEGEGSVVVDGDILKSVVKGYAKKLTAEIVAEDGKVFVFFKGIRAELAQLNWRFPDWRSLYKNLPKPARTVFLNAIELERTIACINASCGDDITIRLDMPGKDGETLRITFRGDDGSPVSVLYMPLVCDNVSWYLEEYNPVAAQAELSTRADVEPGQETA